MRSSSFCCVRGKYRRSITVIRTRYDWNEMTLRLTEAELARDIHAVLARVREEGLEGIVEQDHRPVAVIKTPQGPGRKLSECIAIARAYEKNLGYAPVPDADFAADL